MSSPNVTSKWNGLAELSKVIKNLSQQKCVSDLEELVKQSETLQAKVTEQEATIKSKDETMMAKSDEVTKLKNEHKDRQDEAIEIYTNAIRKKEDEKTALKQDFSLQTAELNEANTKAHNLQEKIHIVENQLKEQTAEVKKIQLELREARSKTATMEKNLKDEKDQGKSKEQQLVAEKKAHGDLKFANEKLNKLYTESQADLKASNFRLKQIDDLAPALIEDNDTEV